jgi:N-acetylglucosaminyldiphosphoundecaprenol N-acetyl-beta-D-mannosaminyltransferase
MRKVDVQGIAIEAIDRSQLEESIIHCIAAGRKEIVAYVNVHAMNIARKDVRFRRFLQTADHVYCDGEGVRLGARLLGGALPQKIVLTRWIRELAQLLARQRYSVFLLGGRDGTVRSAAAAFQQFAPELRIAGFHHGYFGRDGKENQNLIQQIAAVRPHVLFVGLGMPDQEFWIEANKESLNVNAIIPCGGMIDYLSGEKSPPPEWMWRNGLEWLHRLAQDPARLWKRYLIGNPAFMFNILRERFTRTGSDARR